MNIFVLDYSPVLSAQSLHNSHVVKMILESMQMLSTAHRVLDGTPVEVYRNYGKLSKPRKATLWELPDGREGILYKATHRNHPCNVWVRESNTNYQWLLTHVVSLIREYKLRYGRVHKSSELLPFVSKLPLNLPEGPLTSFPLAMPEEYKRKDAIESYRKYYVAEKMFPKGKMASWGVREAPQWIGAVKC